ncbi:unnamed protein product [Protopolystoma xenopodis]|uniref:Uncharacterized protein n=1 Tax=Protopolystoma xenopodis TaxID=117903 RepID=A0A448WBV5_9PLAT|nr:unnamed protein product [Protopolystoma xenopodis]
MESFKLPQPFESSQASLKQPSKWPMEEADMMVQDTIVYVPRLPAIDEHPLRPIQPVEIEAKDLGAWQPDEPEEINRESTKMDISGGKQQQQQHQQQRLKRQRRRHNEPKRLRRFAKESLSANASDSPKMDTKEMRRGQATAKETGVQTKSADVHKTKEETDKSSISVRLMLTIFSQILKKTVWRERRWTLINKFQEELANS